MSQGLPKSESLGGNSGKQAGTGGTSGTGGTGEFAKAAQFNSKADKFFGLDRAESTVKPQKSGWLTKKPFSKGYAAITWKKRWFVLKDAFIFWYADETKGVWDTKPKGCLPLGGATVRTGIDDKLQFEVVHPAFPGQILVLKANDQFEAMEWVEVITAARRATWENAILGSTMVEKMKEKGNALEVEKEEQVQNRARESVRLRKEMDEQESLLEQQLELSRQHAGELAAAASEKKQLSEKASKTREEMTREQQQLEEEKKRREEVERKLKEVQQALSNLEKQFAANTTDKHGAKFSDNDEVMASVKSLKGYFEKKLEEHREYQRKTTVPRANQQ